MKFNIRTERLRHEDSGRGEDQRLGIFCGTAANSAATIAVRKQQHAELRRVARERTEV